MGASMRLKPVIPKLCQLLMQIYTRVILRQLYKEVNFVVYVSLVIYPMDWVEELANHGLFRRIHACAPGPN
jgi:hypothetical protein